MRSVAVSGLGNYLNRTYGVNWRTMVWADSAHETVKEQVENAIGLTVRAVIVGTANHGR